MSKFLHDDYNNDTTAIAIPWVFLKNNRAKNVGNQLQLLVVWILSFSHHVLVFALVVNVFAILNKMCNTYAPKMAIF